MKFTSLTASAAAVLAVAAMTAPSFAGEDDAGSGARVQRNWNGAKSGGGQHVTSNKGTTANSPAAAPSRPTVASGDEDDDGGRAAPVRTRGNGSRYDSQFDLDPAEAARIREAHRETDQHVTLRRDDDGYDSVPSYSTPHRRHWYSWW
jgi:hypothetical protein